MKCEVPGSTASLRLREAAKVAHNGAAEHLEQLDDVVETDDDRLGGHPVVRVGGRGRDELANPLGMANRHLQTHTGAHAVSDDIGTLDPEVLHHRSGVV